MRFALGICFLVGLATVSAQERRAHPGRVVDAAGKPVAGADVLLLTAPILASQFGGGDTVRATTDKNGRFAAKLLGGARYMAFAGNDQAVSGTAVDVTPGRMTVVPLRRAIKATHLTLRGLDAWGERTPVRVRFGAWGADWMEPVPIVDGRVVLPPVYVPALRVQLLDAAGDTLMIAEMLREPVLNVPPPQDVHIEVFDTAGKPVAGAVIKRHYEWNAAGMKAWSPLLELGQWLPCGTTDADGKLHLRIASRRDVFGKKWKRLLLAGREGERVGFTGIEGPRWFDGPAVSYRDRKQRIMRIVLKDGVRLTGKITPETTQPRRVLVRLHTRVGKPFGRGNGRWKFLRAVMDVAPDGTFASDVWPTESIIYRWMVSPPPIELAKDDPFYRLAGKEPMTVPNEGHELKLDAGDVRTQRMHVRAVSGDPGPDVRWWTMPLAGNATYFGRGLSGSCGDPGGRLALPLTKGEWVIALLSDEGFATHHVVVGDEELKTVDLQLTPLARMELQAQGVDGKPLHRAHVHGIFLNVEPFDDPVQQLIASWKLQMTERLLAPLKADTKGLLVMRYPQIQGRELSTLMFGPGNDRRRSEDFVLAPTTEPLLVTLK
jgi:hypothetical protein